MGDVVDFEPKKIAASPTWSTEEWPDDPEVDIGMLDHMATGSLEALIAYGELMAVDSIIQYITKMAEAKRAELEDIK